MLAMPVFAPILSLLRRRPLSFIGKIAIDL